MHTHAIGDLAVTGNIECVEAARKAKWQQHYSGIASRISRFAAANWISTASKAERSCFIAIVLGFWRVTTVDIVKTFIDPSIYKWQYPARSLLQAGALICGASDWPVSSANPLKRSAMQKQGWGRLVFDSTQCMPRIDMLYAYTINAAKLLMMDKSIGSIEPGKFADMVLVDRDILAIAPEAMLHTKVLWTMFEGKIVYKGR